MKTLPLVRALLVLVGLIAASGTAMAAAPAGSQCGVTGVGSVASGVYYNPFAPTSLSNVAVQLALTRVNNGNDKTQQAYFVIVKPDGSPNYQISARAPGGTTYTNVAYYQSQVPGNLPTVSSNTPGQIAYNFGGASQPDTVVFDLLVTVPAGTDLSAGKPISLGIRYVCTGTGGMRDVTTATDQSNAVSIDVHVLSGLQAYYAGSDLNFGEIGTITTASLGATPQKTDANNHFAVKSSGSFNVTLTSQNGYKLKSGGTTGNAEIAYALKFLNKTLSAADPSLNKNCAAVGISSYSTLPIQAALMEGGQGKDPAPSYTDQLTITLTPNAANFAGTTEPCSTYALN